MLPFLHYTENSYQNSSRRYKSCSAYHPRAKPIPQDQSGEQSIVYEGYSTKGREDDDG